MTDSKEGSIDMRTAQEKVADGVAEIMAGVPPLPIRPEAVQAAWTAFNRREEDPSLTVSGVFQRIMYDHLSPAERTEVVNLINDNSNET